jgi:hypothetical protein
MDPVSLIETALVTGAAASAKDTASQAVKDAYTGLKSLLSRLFADKPNAQVILDEHEADPQTYKKPLKKLLTEAYADQYADLLAAAEHLMTLVQPQQIGTGNITIQNTGTMRVKQQISQDTDTKREHHRTDKHNNPKRRPRWVSIILAALSLVIIVGIVFGVVYSEIQQHQLEPPTGFTVAHITLQSGQIMQRGQALRNADIPLTIQGTYTSVGSGLVWVVLRDNFGNYYLQNPPVQFNGDRTWTATNITPGSGVTSIDFVAVTPDGNGTFQRMVSNGDFGAFTQLPQGSLILRPATIPINSSQIGS